MFILNLNSYLKFNSCGYNNGPKTQRMRTNRGDHDRGHAGMDHGGARRHRVRGAPRGGADYQAVALHAGDVLAVQEEVDVGQVGRGPPIDDHLVEDQEIRGGLLGFLVLVVVGVLVTLADHYAAQPAAQREGSVAFENVVYLLLEGRENIVYCPATIVCGWQWLY